MANLSFCSQEGTLLTLVCQVIDKLGVLAVLVGQRLSELKDRRRNGLPRVATEHPLNYLHAGT